MRKKIFIALLIAGVAAVAVFWRPQAPSVSTSSELPHVKQVAPKDSLAWPERAPLGAPRGNPFAAPAAPAARPAAAPPAPAAEAPPPMPYRIAGRVVRDGVSQLLLAKGSDVVAVQQGDMLEGGYRVESIGAEDVTLLYLPLGVRQTITP